MVLHWRPVIVDKETGEKSEHALVSDCGRYKVCHVTVSGRKYFEAWTGGECIAREPGKDSSEMRAVCQRHADRNDPGKYEHEHGDDV